MLGVTATPIKSVYKQEMVHQVLPVEDICTNSNNMAAYKETIPAFRYNPAVVPPYSLNNAHWYLCKYKDNGVLTYNFISFITNTQQEIVNHLESCTDAWLWYVPLPDSDSI